MDDEVRRRLDALILERREDYASLSRLLGRNPAYVQQFIKRGVPRKLDEADRRKLADYFAIDEALLGGPARAADELIAVPVVDVAASAGPGAFADAERSRARMRFDPAWLAGLRLDPRHLSVIRVAGDSMAPTLLDGDDILVDRAPRPFRAGIHVIRLDGVLNVKRLIAEPGRKLTIASDNPDHPTLTGVDRAQVEVIGRVVWAGRRL